nr:unnamed protein product [Callosobruchus chinensis]
MSNVVCDVVHDENPMVPIDIHHPALIVRISEITVENSLFKTNSQQKSYNSKKANYPALYVAIAETDLPFLRGHDDINIVVDRFYNNLYKILNEHVPIYKNYKRRFPCWLNSEIIRSSKLKEKYYRNFKRTGDIRYETEPKRLKCLIKLQIKTAYNQYIIGVGNSLQSEPTPFWTFFNQKNISSRILGEMVYNGAVLDDPQSIVEGFGNFFKRVYSISQYQDRTDELIIDQIFDVDLVSEPISEDEIFEANRKLKDKQTSGPDNIPSFLVKDCMPAFANALMIIYNLVLSSLTFPDRWKESRVRPVYKSEDRRQVSNY